ncbi:MAG TPA: hypothetical protein EYP88_02535, partial [Anaerolineales bacterium]|nr:hypothetical protein [Anaerolineales bacterium]
MPTWLKSGLIGGAILFVLDVVIQIPVLGCCGWFLTVFAYLGIGALAAYFAERPRDTGKAAGQGAIAAVLAAFIGGIFNFIFGLIRASLFDMTDAMSQLPP